MPRKKHKILPGMEKKKVNCFAFYVTKSGKPSCRALKEIYCLTEYEECTFFATPAEAEKSQAHARELLRR